MAKTSAANPPHRLHITFRNGFRGHTVVIVVDGREVYRRAGVTTDRHDLPTDVVVVDAGAAVVSLAVSATPGDIAASLEVDVSRHPHMAIDLVGGGTVGFELFPRLR
jgi:hypothetical protein